MLRPRACHWFELITARESLAPVLETLARAGAVELQAHERRAAPLVVEGAERPIERFHELAKTYGPHWPPVCAPGATQVTDPARTLATRVAQLEAWRSDAEPLIAARERLLSESRALADVGRLLQSDPATLPQPGLLSEAGRFMVDFRLYAARQAPAASELPAEVLALTLPAAAGDGEGLYVLLVGPRELMPLVDERCAALKARRIAWPAELHGSASEAAQQVAARIAAHGQRLQALDLEIDALAARHELAQAIADLQTVEWLIRHGRELAASDRLVWVSGWTTAADAEALSAPLRRQGLRCVVQFPGPPPGCEPPSVLANPPWVRAFEAFARLLGQPGRDEADPSALVAVVAPVLFGFMFGDVGQGAVLCGAGWWLRKRVPMLVLLVPGGAMAMVFGVLFGTVFAREDLIPALWMRPLHEPVRVLAAAVALGAVILLGGLTLSALEAAWRREARQWWARDAGLLAAYLGVLGLAWQPLALWLLPLGALWFMAGSLAADAAHSPLALARGLAEFAEHALQLLVNTVSFARVGAFALAHAGLSVAVVGVAEASGALGYGIVLLLGNLLILVLEGLVVGIQTTRLLLFEFFVRFLKGSGRVFKPLPPP